MTDDTPNSVASDVNEVEDVTKARRQLLTTWQRAGIEMRPILMKLHFTREDEVAGSIVTVAT